MVTHRDMTLVSLCAEVTVRERNVDLGKRLGPCVPDNTGRLSLHTFETIIISNNFSTIAGFHICKSSYLIKER